MIECYYFLFQFYWHCIIYDSCFNKYQLICLFTLCSVVSRSSFERLFSLGSIISMILSFISLTASSFICDSNKLTSKCYKTFSFSSISCFYGFKIYNFTPLCHRVPFPSTLLRIFLTVTIFSSMVRPK